MHAGSDRLPAIAEALAHWLRLPFPREPLCVERSGERLIVETPTKRRAHGARGESSWLSLTAREREVMNRVADGMSTNGSRSTLVTPSLASTRGIYRKLGVKGRNRGTGRTAQDTYDVTPSRCPTSCATPDGNDFGTTAGI